MRKMIMKLDTELRESGELVDGQKLTDPSQATTVRLVGSLAEIKRNLRPLRPIAVP